MTDHVLSSDFTAVDLRKAAALLSALCIAAVAVIALWRRPRVGHCARCGHDLRGIAGDRCPECGHAVSVGRAALPPHALVARESRVSRLGRFCEPAAVTGLVLGLCLAALAWFAQPVTAWVKTRAAESLSDRDLAARAMKPDGGDAGTALRVRARAIATGTRASDGSLADAAALRSVLDGPMVHPFPITDPLTAFSPELENEMSRRFTTTDDLAAFLADRPQDMLKVARALTLDRGGTGRNPLGIVAEEHFLSTLLLDHATLSALAHEDFAQSVFRFAPRAMVLREGTIVRWLLGPADTVRIHGLSVFSGVFARSARMRCDSGEGRIIEIELVVSEQPVPGGTIPFIELMVPEGVCDEGEFILELELTPASVHGAADGSSSVVIETRVPFGYDSPRIPASR
jgi:hypothetical protein